VEKTFSKEEEKKDGKDLQLNLVRSKIFLMLKKQNRLSADFEFNITKKYGTHYEGKYFHCYVLKPKNYSGTPKFGIVISNKFHKSAAKRNRAKRLFREVIRKNLKKFNDDLWFSVYPKKNVLQATYEKISTDFNKTLQKIFITN